MKIFFVHFIWEKGSTVVSVVIPRYLNEFNRCLTSFETAQTPEDITLYGTHTSVEGVVTLRMRAMPKNDSDPRT